MRRVSVVVRSRGIIAVLALVVVLVAPVLQADDNPLQPPEAKIGPPIGSSSAGIDPTIGCPEVFRLVWLLARAITG